MIGTVLFTVYVATNFIWLASTVTINKQLFPEDEVNIGEYLPRLRLTQVNIRETRKKKPFCMDLQTTSKEKLWKGLSLSVAIFIAR
jgi:hypothetical protein